MDSTSNDCLAKLDTIIANYFDFTSASTADDTAEFERQRMIHETLLELLDTLSKSRPALLATSDIKGKRGLIRDLRTIIEQIDFYNPYRNKQFPMDERVVYGLHLPTLELMLADAYAQDYQQLLKRLRSCVEKLITPSKLDMVAALISVFISELAKGRPTLERLQKNAIVVLIHSPWFYQLQNYLVILDESVVDSWEFQAATSEMRSAQIELGTNCLLRKLSDPYDDRAWMNYWFIVEDSAKGKSIRIDKYISASRMQENGVVWLVLENRTPIYINGQTWQFKPDPRDCSSAETEWRPLDELPAWVQSLEMRRQ